MSTVSAVRRFDRATLGKATRLDNGFIRAPARLTRTGVFEYQQDGKIVRELRLPEEVFAPVSLDSFAMKPLVDNHPAENNGVVDSKNARRLTVGTVGTPTRDGIFMVADLMITDAATAAKVEAGKREVSCGYFCDREPAEAGAVWKDPATGDLVPYDFIQRNIRGNHVAIVDAARAGHEARISLDSQGQQAVFSQTAGDQPQQGKDKMKFQIHGVDYEIDPAIAQAIGEERKINADVLAGLKSDATKAKSEADKSTARADSADAKVTELTGKLNAATDPKALSAAVSERVALENKAVAILGKEVKLDALSNAEIKRLAIAKSNPALKLDGKSADYVDCAFDLIDAKAVDSTVNPITAAARANLATAPVVTDRAPLNADDAKRKYRASIFAQDAATVAPTTKF